MSVTPRTTRFTIAAAAVLILTGEADAYLGPGAGLSAIGSALALIGAVLAALFGFLWFPIKRLLRKKTDQNDEVKPPEETPES